MNQVTPPPSAETQILSFARSRAAFTLAELSSYCTASDWKTENALSDLKRRQVIRACGKHEGRTLLTIHEPGTAHRHFVNGTMPMEWRDAAVQTEIREAVERSQADSFWAPSDEDLERLWAWIEKRPEFTKRQFMDQEALPAHRLELMFQRWRRSGRIRFLGRKDNVGLFTGVSDRQRMEEARDKRLSLEGRLWSAIRVSKVFTPVDLEVRLAGSDWAVSSQMISRYCEDLVKFGYVKILRKRTRRNPARYQLVRNTGPLPPVAKRVTCLIDPNQDTVLPHKDAING